MLVFWEILVIYCLNIVVCFFGIYVDIVDFCDMNVVFLYI